MPTRNGRAPSRHICFKARMTRLRELSSIGTFSSSATFQRRPLRKGFAKTKGPIDTMNPSGFLGILGSGAHLAQALMGLKTTCIAMYIVRHDCQRSAFLSGGEPDFIGSPSDLFGKFPLEPRGFAVPAAENASREEASGRQTASDGPEKERKCGFGPWSMVVSGPAYPTPREETKQPSRIHSSTKTKPHA